MKDPVSGLMTLRFGASHNDLVLEPGKSTEVTIDLGSPNKRQLKTVRRLVSEVLKLNKKRGRQAKARA